MTAIPCLLNLAMPLNPQLEMVTAGQAMDILQQDNSHADTYDAYESSLNCSHSSTDPCDLKSLSVPTTGYQQPITFLVPTMVKGLPCKKFLSALLDTGPDTSFIREQCLPSDAKPTKVELWSVVSLH